MTRKRDAWTRARSKHARPKTPAPKHGWLLSELAQLTGLAQSRVRYYVRRQVIHPIELRGTATRYDRRNFLRLLGLMRLKTEEDSKLTEKLRRLAAMTNQQLEHWLCSGPLPEAAAAALGLQPVAGRQAVTQSVDPLPGLDAGSPAGPTSATPAGGAFERGRVPIEHWHRIALLPGLELMLRVDANEATHFAAREIREQYASK